MQNKNNKIIIVFLIILVLVLGYFLFRTEEAKAPEDGIANIPIPSGFTQTNLNPNGPDYQPQGHPSISLDMSSPYAQQYKTQFTQEFSQPANFNGHFRLVEIGCGSNCQMYYALDQTTGKIYKVPVAADHEATFSLNSDTVIIHGAKSDYSYFMGPQGFEPDTGSD